MKVRSSKGCGGDSLRSVLDLYYGSPPPWPRLRGAFFWRMLCLVFCKSIAMPSKSAKQARLMAAAAHDPAFAKKVGIPVSVAKEFNKADAKTGILRKRKKR